MSKSLNAAEVDAARRIVAIQASTLPAAGPGGLVDLSAAGAWGRAAGVVTNTGAPVHRKAPDGPLFYAGDLERPCPEPGCVRRDGHVPGHGPAGGPR